MAGIPKISGNSLYFGSPDTPWFSKLNWVWRVSKKWWVAACIGYLLVPEYEYQIYLSAIATLVLERPPPSVIRGTAENRFCLSLLAHFILIKIIERMNHQCSFHVRRVKTLNKAFVLRLFQHSTGSPRLVMKHFFELWGRPIPLGLILCIAIYL